MLPFFILYGILLFTLFLGAFFILYHILRYSLSRSLGYFGAFIFVGVFLFLTFANFLSFQALEPTQFTPDFELGPVLPDSLTVPSASTRNPW